MLYGRGYFETKRCKVGEKEGELKKDRMRDNSEVKRC